ncbi:LPS-assembly protein LptD [Wielerella bovis]|uniref:LPS-assembly protein LptD n=1 Tax=Wielerella bovis TaxID=2917790 RepID=UPI003D28C822
MVMALGLAFSGSVSAASDTWSEDAPALCHEPNTQQTKTHAVAPAKKSGEPKLGQDVTRIVSDKALGQTNVRHRAEGDVIVERNDEVLNAEWVDYDQQTETVVAGDKFKLTRADGQTVEGEKLHYDLKNSQGSAENAEFEANHEGRRLQGVGGHIVMENKKNYKIQDVKFNTCNPGDKSWYIQAASLKANNDTGIGVAEHAKLVFGGVPILYAPWVDFPIDGNRKSGFLVPTVKTGSDGLQVELPYYMNLAPNYDATVAPGFIADRGATLAGEFRYKQPKYSGSLNANYMPHDRERKRNNRYSVNIKHNHQFTNELSGGVDFNQASDDYYYQDFSGRNEIAENVNLDRKAWLNYNTLLFGETLSAQLLVQKHQTLRDANGNKDEPYAILPRLSANWNKQIGNGNLDVWTQITRFEHDSKQNGIRAIVYPSIKWDFHNQWGYVRPKIGVHATRYALDEYGSLKSRNASRILPIINVDSGITLERETSLMNLFGGKRFVQTLEPRLFYNYIPSKSQNDLPVFDTIANSNFSYDQLFRENIYTGHDRINSSNSLSTGLQTRILDRFSGEEFFRAGMGQKYYFTDDNVLLNGTIGQHPRSRSDFVAFAGGRVASNWWADAHWHWNESSRKTENLDLGVRYNPEAGKVVSVRFKSGRNEEIYSGFYDKLRHIDIGAQWPITPNLYAVGRLDYSISPRAVLEQTLGFEYRNPCGCWSASFVGQRYISALNKHKTAFFFTLQLKDLSNIGNNPYETLRLSIPGYTKTNDVNSNKNNILFTR